MEHVCAIWGGGKINPLDCCRDDTTDAGNWILHEWLSDWGEVPCFLSDAQTGRYCITHGDDRALCECLFEAC